MADVSVDLELNAKQAKHELSSFEGTLKGFAGSVKSALGGFAAGFAGAFSLGALKDVILSTVKYGSTIQDLSDKYHVSTTFLQQYGQAAEKAGASQESLAKALKFLEVNQAKAIGGDSTAQNKFKDIGIGIEQLRSLNPEQLFAAVSTSSLNAAEMVGLLGKNGLELVGLFDQIKEGTAGLDKVSIISPEDIALLDKFDDTLITIQNTLRKVAAVFVTEAIPALGEFLNKVIESIGPIAAYNEFVKRTDKTPQGEAAADSADTDVAAIAKRHREEAGLAPVPDAVGLSEKKADLGPPKLTTKAQDAIDKEAVKEHERERKASDKEIESEVKAEEKQQKDQAKDAKDSAREANKAQKAAKAAEKDKFGGGTASNPNQLTLQDLANAPNSIGNAQAAKARDALRLEKESKEAQIRGDLRGAQEKKSRAEQLKKELGLKEPKDEFQEALDGSEILKKIEKNTGGGAPNK